MEYQIDIEALAEEAARATNRALRESDTELELFALKLRTSVAIAERLERIADQLGRSDDSVKAVRINRG